MEKEGNLQLELFKQSESAAHSGKSGFSSSFLAHIWNYEKTILIIIAIAITSIISFSLGVEKGKKLVMLNSDSRVSAPAIIQRPLVNSTEEPIKQPAIQGKENYVIRLASYKMKTHAQEEAQLLKKRGLSPLVLSKGSYILLCVGNISNKQTAQSMLVELKKRYKDCYITRL